MVPSSAEECRGVPSSYHCNTTKIDRVEQPRTVCGAEECREVPRSAEECRVVPGRGGADIGEPLSYSTTIAIPLK